MRRRRARRWASGCAVGLLALACAEILGHLIATTPAPRAEGSGLVVGHHPGLPFLRHSDEAGGYVRARQEATPYLFVPDEKPPGTLRVAVLGAAAVRVSPPDGPAWQLGALIEAGGGHVQVVAAGARGYGTARLRDLQRELLGHDLDAIVLFTGECEFQESRSFPSLDQRRSALGRTFRGVAGRSAILGLLWRARGAASVPAGAVPGAQAPLLAPERARLARHFGARLEAMARDVDRAGVPAVWVLPASGLGHPPRASLAPAGAEDLDRALAAAEAGAPADLEPLLARYPDHAALWYHAGTARLAAGDRPGALDALGRARDLDALPVRATADQRRIEAEVAGAHGIAVVDAEGLLLEADEERYLRGRFGNHYELLTAEAWRIVMEEVYGVLAGTLPGLAPLPVLREHLPSAAPLPLLSVAPAPQGPVLAIDFRPSGDGPAGPSERP